jgi:hypothetical protein
MRRKGYAAFVVAVPVDDVGEVAPPTIVPSGAVPRHLWQGEY